MKKTIMALTIALMAVAAQAKDIKTVVFTTNPKMSCENCEKKIKGNLRYEKGVKSIDTNVEQQKVTVKYDADKTSAETLQKAFEKFGYKAEQVGKASHTECDDSQRCGKTETCGDMQHCNMQSNSDKKQTCCKQQGNQQDECCKMKQTGDKQEKANCKKNGCKKEQADKNKKKDCCNK